MKKRYDTFAWGFIFGAAFGMLLYLILVGVAGAEDTYKGSVAPWLMNDFPNVLYISNDYSIDIAYTPAWNVAFYNEENEEIGRLSWDKGYLEFTGTANDSAKVFFEYIKVFINAWIVENCGKEANE